MTDKQTNQTAISGNAEKDPSDWVTGDEPMTGAQRSYLKTLSEEAHTEFDDSLTKAQASVRIEELQRITGRGQQNTSAHTSGVGEPDSSAGEEDPGADLDDPEMRDAIQGEQRIVQGSNHRKVNE
jgi:Protein of unknown function (DUF3072)